MTDRITVDQEGREYLVVWEDNLREIGISPVIEVRDRGTHVGFILRMGLAQGLHKSQNSILGREDSAAYQTLFPNLFFTKSSTDYASRRIIKILGVGSKEGDQILDALTSSKTTSTMVNHIKTMLGPQKIINACAVALYLQNHYTNELSKYTHSFRGEPTGGNVVNLIEWREAHKPK